jgi:hypothetical protein
MHGVSLLRFLMFVSIWLLLLFSIMMDNITGWLAQFHGILQGNAGGFKSSLVFGNAMSEQSTKAIVKLESAVELLVGTSPIPNHDWSELKGWLRPPKSLTTSAQTNAKQ